MKKIGSLVFLVALGIATIALDTEASSCRVVTVRAHNAYAVHDHHAAAVVVPYYQHQAYSIGYAPDLSKIVADLIEDNKQMRAQLIEAIKATPTGPGPLLPLKAKHPGQEVMAAKCAICHDEGSHKAKGGGHLLFKGGEFIDTGDNLSRAVEQMDSGKMPRGGKLTDTEKYQVLSSLVIRPDTAKK